MASACSADPVGIHHLLDYLTCVGTLTRQGEAYALTPTSAAFFVRHNPAYVGDLIRYEASGDLFKRVLGSLQEGRPVYLTEYYEQDAWIESYSGWRIQFSLDMWKAAGVTISTDLSLRVLDIACGCAVKSLVLAQASPQVQLTCLDTPAVLAVARDLAGRMGVLSQVEFLPADLTQQNFGQQHYNAVLTGQITHHLTAEQVQDLFRRIYTCLKAGGRYVLDCPMSGESPTEQTASLGLLLWAHNHARIYTFEEYRLWLQQAGFGEVEQLSPRLIVARK